jgi:hypothetical protein
MSRWIPLVLVGACCPPEPAKKVTHTLPHRLAKRAHDASAAFCKYADTFIDEANSSPRCSALRAARLADPSAYERLNSIS